MRSTTRGWLAGLVGLSLLAAVAPALSGPQTPSAASKPAAASAQSCRFPLPLPTKVGEAAFDKQLYAFLEARCYDKQTPAWARDRELRDTGPFINPNNFGTHPAVRVYYSPEVVKWLQDGRKGEIPDGAMIVKEMYDPPAGPDSEFSAWTAMVRDRQGSWDGWYWSYHAPPSASPSAPASPSKEEARTQALGYPNSGFGQYCTNCHASADNSQSTYSSRRNFETDDPLTYLVVQPSMDDPSRIRKKRSDPHSRKALGPVEEEQEAAAANPNPGFEKTYGPPPGGPGPVKDFPVETWDHVVAGPPPAGPQQFITSDQCIGCHDATQNMAAPPNMIYPAAGGDGPITNLSPYGEWRASLMGLAGRDPVFYAQLDSELTLHDQKKDLPPFVQNLCFRCHGAMGQRQLGIDSHDKRPFLESMVYAAGHEPDAQYGALAREGVSCTVCHHVAPQGLGTPATFTGQFKVGPANEVYGPFEKPAVLPMKQGVGMTPVQAPQIQSAALCGSCHAIKLPVLNARGEQVGEEFEQATYLEWLNSVFQNERQPVNPASVQTCQNCHMPTTFAAKGFQAQDLAYRIASIEDETFPMADNRAPAGELHLAIRSPYARHMLLGINLFVLKMFEQFWNPIGIRTEDPMATYGNPVPGLKTAFSSGLSLAQKETATVELSPVKKTADGLEASVKVTNLAGHSFPSGVEFRRAFLQLEVLDATGEPLWASGATSNLGVILDGPSGQPLPSEFFQRGPDGQQAYQPHYEVITRQDQVQIYEELVKDTEGRFTTSFLSLYQRVKNNKLQPRGWSPTGPWAEVTKPVGGAADDPSYRDGSGSDTVLYKIPLDAATLQKVKRVRATLWYQSTPPYYLNQRFTQANGPDTHRLYVFTRDLDLGKTPVQSWRLRIAGASRGVS